MASRRRRQRANGMIEIDASGALDMLDGLSERLKNMKPVNEKIVDVMQIQQAERFHTTKFPELAESTRKRKEAEGESTEVFRDESRRGTRVPEGLYNVITQPRFPGQIRRSSKFKATFGINTKGQFFYAPLAAKSTRKLLGMNTAHITVITRMVGDFLIKGKSR